MQIIRSLHKNSATPVGFAIKVLLLSSEADGGQLARRLAALGAQVDVTDEMFTALADIIDDPIGYGLLVMECDGTNADGLEGGLRAVKMMGDLVTKVPVILVSKECQQQRFPEDRIAPTQLRAPVSSISLKVGFEHALRDRLAYRAI
jgi:hypothetical protein